ncbi:DUF4198 domain-containing protein [Gemmata sp. JC673]|uniref:DUF4198 domain-containing protein n=1 Tax=Gemmata algarum TaxID=2975278 RepID=A0ABU5F8W3_9BACT|nr:hypothetical protein [Gemmata algarum]MDY3563175.1 DUF4198 domain-containing protein [Gemmata algarum]
MKRALVTLLVAALAAGCSDSGPQPNELAPHPVHGKVMYDGKPAAGVIVTLIPSDAPMVPHIPRNPQSVTTPDGTFALSTFADGDGAPEGGYQVVFRWPGEKNAKAEGEAQEDTDRLMGWYDGTHSTLTCRVKPGRNDLPTFNLPKVDRPPPASRGVPGRN